MCLDIKILNNFFLSMECCFDISKSKLIYFIKKLKLMNMTLYQLRQNIWTKYDFNSWYKIKDSDDTAVTINRVSSL